MRHVVVSLAMVAAVATAAVLPAQGQTTSQSGSSSRGAQAEVVAAAFSAEVTGKVQTVDPSTGVLTLQTVDGPINVRFPPPAVQAIKPGDQVTVAFGLVKQPPAATPSPGSSTSPGTK
jgi:hypothetical protein